MFPQSLDDDVKRNWEQLMKEMPPPPEPDVLITADEFERAMRVSWRPASFSLSWVYWRATHPLKCAHCHQRSLHRRPWRS